mmetsp:Transcript_35152/g.88586  ORF Transcript_35152/g.88586 Transcript_35152/m.88586 type:complete len:205 (-) Transcript_35152:193-807(-)
MLLQLGVPAFSEVLAYAIDEPGVGCKALPANWQVLAALISIPAAIRRQVRLRLTALAACRRVLFCLLVILFIAVVVVGILHLLDAGADARIVDAILHLIKVRLLAVAIVIPIVILLRLANGILGGGGCIGDRATLLLCKLRVVAGVANDTIGRPHVLSDPANEWSDGTVLAILQVILELLRALAISVVYAHVGMHRVGALGPIS